MYLPHRMLPNDRLICVFMEPHDVGLQFSRWLLHVTIVPWFRLNETSEVIANGLEKSLYDIEPFEAKVVGQEMFGPRKNRPAMLIEVPTPFNNIEQKVRSYLHKKRAWLVDETTKKPRSFRPHVTVQGDKTILIGETFRIDQLYIIEQKGDFKEIAGKVLLDTKPAR
jgi:2'-5' RNA ligase